MELKRKVNHLLFSLIVLDVTLTIVGVFFPQVWFTVFHGTLYVDPQGLFPRTAAIWAAFAVFQFIAWRRWQKELYWLVLVAGLRWAEIFADWTYLFSADDITRFGMAALFVASPVNAWLGWTFVNAYKKLNR